jgi:hypothetical protein
MSDDIEAERALLRLILKDHGGYVGLEAMNRGTYWFVVDMSTDITPEQAELVKRIWSEDQ